MDEERLAAAANEHLLRFVGDGVVGMVVGMVAGDGELIVNRGAVSAEGTFPIGSITKVFTGLLLADMALRGQVDLDDPVARFLPASVRVPCRDGKEITLLDLATHTAGLPRLPRNLFLRAVVHSSDPYRGYTAEDLYRGLAGTRLRRTPGSTYSYSNFGYALLGQALACAGGDSYEGLVTARVCRPMGLAETSAQPTPGGARAETGHGRKGRPVPEWELAAFAPAGGLRSTMADMVRFIRANLHPGCTALGSALEAAQRPLRRIGTGEQIGLGWHLRHDGGTVVHWHNGGTGGFGSFVAFAGERQSGLAVLYNSPTSPAADAAAFRLLSELSG